MDRKVSILDWRSEYFQNKLKFHVEGTLIDVTMLERGVARGSGVPPRTFGVHGGSRPAASPGEGLDLEVAVLEAEDP